MKLSWTSLKVSIAGAKLSHLVQQDKIWDHGSMTEQVKNVFYQLEKAKNRGDAEIVKKYLTHVAYEKMKTELEQLENLKSGFKNSVIKEISIIHVRQAKKEKPDGFIALVKGKRKISDDLIPIETSNYGIENFSEEWQFVRDGEWWLLDDMKTK